MTLVRSNLSKLLSPPSNSLSPSPSLSPHKLRSLIVDLSTPAQDLSLPTEEFWRENNELLKPLNNGQIRAIRKSLHAKDYALILGMPGTGEIDHHHLSLSLYLSLYLSHLISLSLSLYLSHLISLSL